MFELELPWPLTINHYYGNGGRSRKYLPKIVEDYRMEVFALFKNSKQKAFDDGDDLVVHVYLFPPDRRRRDIDNISKCLLDALEYAGVFKNDNQISKLILDRQQERKCLAHVKIECREEALPWQCL